MTCHYLEEDGYRKICRAKGISPPTINELRLYCYKNAYICPIYKRYIQRLAKQQSTENTQTYENYLQTRGNPEEQGLI